MKFTVSSTTYNKDTYITISTDATFVKDMIDIISLLTEVSLTLTRTEAMDLIRELEAELMDIEISERQKEGIV